MLTFSDAIKELGLKSESELTLDYLEDLTKRISIKDPKASTHAVTYYGYFGHKQDIYKD